MDLDIHLDCCDTFVCTGYLEVHISEEVFKSLNICKYDVIIICSPVTSPQEIPATGALIGTPAAISDIEDAQILA